MHAHRPFADTAHQRRRYALWVMAMLHWIAALLIQAVRPTKRQFEQRGEVSIARLTHLVITLLVIRAAERSRIRSGAPRCWRHGRTLLRRHFMRSVLGSRLRRAIKPKDTAARIGALIHALRHLDDFADQLARRMLTRLWGILPARTPNARVFDVAAPTLVAADSS
jgi:hypothetical protein